MVEVLQNLIEVAAILQRMSEPLPDDTQDEAPRGNLWDEFEPVDGITYL